MPFDLALGLVVVLSGLLAMARGLLREVLTLVAWIGAGLIGTKFAAFAGVYVQPFLGGIENSEKLAEFIGGVVIFFIALLVLSILSVSLSNRVLDSRVGVFDRTLGLAYGCTRGLVIFSLFYLLAVKLELVGLLEPFAENSLSRDIVVLVSEALGELTLENISSPIPPPIPI